jgi:hypothetical protein
MAVNYFKNFPVVQYDQQAVRNIILKAKIAKNLVESYDAFYPYTIKTGETPTSLSYDYYGTIDYVWLIFIANDIVDPYYDWPLDQEVFDQFIIKKYGSIAESMNLANGSYYRNPNYSYWMTSTTYDNLSSGERASWTIVSNYDYEFYKNEEKRKIKLLDRSIAADVAFELERTLKRVNKP